MKNSSLVLCPVDPDWIPSDADRIERLLRSIRFIGAPLSGARCYLAGERFLHLVAFMGCSPGVRLEPGDDGDDFCFIELSGDAGSIQFRCGAHTGTPRCEQCGAPFTDWKSAVARWQHEGGTTRWQCSACGREAPPWEYDWRKSAGFGRCFIEINSIFPREAIPQQQLLDTLNSHYRVDWHYFYQY